jgi:hypothetical protein
LELRSNSQGTPKAFPWMLVPWSWSIGVAKQLPRNAEGVPVHPAVECLNVGAFWKIDSFRAAPSHPELIRLGLLPSGPDPIHDAPPQRDPDINIDRTSADPISLHPRAGIQLRMKRISDRGHP